jgi:hypothetical protein
MTDITYRIDGLWMRFYPVTEAGENLWREMHAQGNDVILSIHKNNALKQLRALGCAVSKAKPSPKRFTKEDEALLAELMA